MQVELDIDELRTLNELLAEAVYIGKAKDLDSILDKVVVALDEAEELESIDLNDCAGGACKL